MNSRFKKLGNINIKPDKFNDISDLKDILYQIVGGRKCAINSNELFAYSYVCIDSNCWNEQNDFNKISSEFLKFKDVLPEDYASSFEDNYANIKNVYSKWKYSMYGFSKKGGVVFSSDTDTFNFTKLPFYYETVYFYTMILALYRKLSNEKIYRITNSEHVENLWKCWEKNFSFEKIDKKSKKQKYNLPVILDAIFGLVIISLVLNVCILIEKETLYYKILNLMICIVTIAIICIEKKKNK